jgi:plastocyanin
MRVALAALALAAAAAGCGGSGDSTPVATNHVTMVKSYRFDPEKVVIKPGDTVTWKNDDNFTHTVHVDGQDDHTVERGESVSITFPKAGTFHYVCRLHSHDMQGEVIVR